MPPDVPSAFFSYCRADSDFALKLAEDLKAAGANVWMDQLDIEPGTPWDCAVEEALIKSSCMLVILSPVSATSNNVRDEVSFALSRQKRVIPILYRDCDVPFRMARLQHIDFRTDYARGLKALIRTLGMEQPAQASTPAPAPSAMTPTSVPDAEERTTANTRATEEDRERKAAEEKARALDRQRIADEKARLERLEREEKAQLQSEEQAQPVQFGRANQLYHIGEWRLYRTDYDCCFWYDNWELALEVDGNLQAWRLREGGTECTIIHGQRHAKAKFRNQFWKTTTPRASPIVVGGSARFEIEGFISPETNRLIVSALPTEIRITDNSGFGSQIVLPRHEARIHHRNYLGEEFEYP
ncbi:MAG: TIR domain-containing protein [Acidobacteriota bacterium]